MQYLTFILKIFKISSVDVILYLFISHVINVIKAVLSHLGLYSKISQSLYHRFRLSAQNISLKVIKSYKVITNLMNK